MPARDDTYDPLPTLIAGFVAGLATCLVYPLLIALPLVFSPPPDWLGVLLAAAMGPLLGIASWGLREFLNLERRRLSADLGAMSNALAGALLTAMLLVQLAIGQRTDDHPTVVGEAVWLGLDVAWDVYIGVGTLFFAWNAMRHPRLGRVVGGGGLAIAAGLLAFNLFTFPLPPANAGLVDLGPLVGFWYLVVTILGIRSLGWARERAAEGEP